MKRDVGAEVGTSAPQIPDGLSTQESIGNILNTIEGVKNESNGSSQHAHGN
jgi:hypothetical protein